MGRDGYGAAGEGQWSGGGYTSRTTTTTVHRTVTGPDGQQSSHSEVSSSLYRSDDITRKHEPFNRWWINGVPASVTLAQH